MTIVIFGLVVSSSWGNGHATLWRGLIKAMGRRGHRVIFFERDTLYYSQTRDLTELVGGRLELYSSWEEIKARARILLNYADVSVVTSFCPDAIDAEQLMIEASRGVRVFYDLDTPVTLAALSTEQQPHYVGSRAFADYDLVFSYTGGQALEALTTRLGAKRVAPLYGHVDAEAHYPVPAVERFRSSLSYVGTYAADRQAALVSLFIEPARKRPERTFLIAGAQYPQDFPWRSNIFFARHVPPSDHPELFCSGRLTLNVTRQVMAAMGYCPSGRLFEAAACGTAIVSDLWEGLETFFVPGREILVARSTDEALEALDLSDTELASIAREGRERVLAEHTSGHRVAAFEAAIAGARS